MASIGTADDKLQWTGHGANRILSRSIRLQPIDASVDRVVVTAMAADPRGHLLAVAGDDHVIRILHVDTMRLLHTLGDGKRDSTSGHTDWIRTMTFDPTGRRLASAGNDGRFIIWNRDRDFAIHQEINSAPALACIRFDPFGQQIAAVGFSRNLFLIGMAATPRQRIACDCADLRCCAYRDDGRLLVVGGRDGHLVYFDPVSGREVADKNRFTAEHEERIRDIAFLPRSNTLLSVGEDGRLLQINSQAQRVDAEVSLTSGRLFSVIAVSPQCAVAAGSDDTLYVVKLATATSSARLIETLDGHRGSVPALAMIDTILFSGGFDATLRRWDVSDLLRTTDPAEEKLARRPFDLDEQIHRRVMPDTADEEPPKAMDQPSSSSERPDIAPAF
ncbi:MAG: WD40 repeat domain-containing protein [Planctomycetota bacterium]